MAGTWLASTCRSGSATVMIMPMRKPTTVMIHTFFRRVISEPTACPSGIMDISDPSVNSPMPAISITPPSRNATMALLGTRRDGEAQHQHDQHYRQYRRQ